ncbi:MFS transporter [Streptomyces sp. IBSNAI002]|uniref:MFS transporter n=1 Tax=Streptomyces sp. IBSNAI002 TaxID=3457500 RepID=UPI003FD1BDE6
MTAPTTPVPAAQAPAPDPAPTAARPSLWRNGDFLKLWSGQTVSLCGTYVTQLALPFVALTVFDASASQVGTLTAVQFLPVLLLTVFAGRWADRRRRRPLLVGADLVRAAALAAVPLAWWADGLSLGLLYAVGFAVGCCNAVFDVAYLSYLPSLVDRRDLVAANSKLQGSYAVAQVGGPGLGGLLIRFAGAPLALLIDVASYLVSAVSLLLIRTREDAPARPRPDEDGGLARQLGAGFTFIRKDPALRLLTLKGAWFNLCEQALLTVFLVYAVRELGLGAGALGTCIGLGSLGAVLGTVLARRAGRALGVARVLVGSMLLGCAAPALILLSDGSGPGSLALITGAFAVFSIGFTVFNVYFVTLRQTITPPDRLGRVTAAYRTVAFGTFPLGAWAGGALAGPLGLRTALVVVCAAFAAGWLLFAASSRVLRPLTVSLD